MVNDAVCLMVKVGKTKETQQVMASLTVLTVLDVWSLGWKGDLSLTC
jgi:hypothetical protein